MRLFSWRSILPLMLMLAMVAAVACSSDDDDGDGGGGDTERPSELADEQVLNANLTAEPETLDPQRATDSVSLTVLSNLYSGLLRLNPELELEADVATDVPTVENGGISEDGLTYTFHLRDDLKWDDGTPLVAQAFVDGARHLFEPGSGNYYVDFYRVLAADGPNGDANQAVVAALGEGLEGDALTALEQAVVDGLRVEAPDDQTVVYHLSQPSPVFLLLSSMWPLWPIRQDILDASGDQWTEAGTLVSNGPFKLAAWNHGEDIQLVKNEHWHGEDVAIETINMDMIGDTAVSFLAYQNNELDMITLGPAELVQVRNDPALQEEFRSYAQLNTIGIYLNAENEFLDDPLVRQAFAGALDREEYAEVVREGAVLPAYGWVPPGMPGHDEEVGMQYQDAVEDSQALLEDAGFPGGAGIEVTILASDQSISALTAEWLKEQWETNLGVVVNIDVKETATYFEERNAGEFDIVTGGWGADYPDPQNWLPLFKTGGGLNSGNFSDAEFDRLVDEADLELDNDARIELYLEAQEILIDLAPFTPLYYGRRNVLVKPWVHGMVNSSMEREMPGDVYLDQVWIDGRP